MLLDNMDLKNQLKQFRKGYKAGVTYLNTSNTNNSMSVTSANGIDSKRLSSHRGSMQMAP